MINTKQRNPLFRISKLTIKVLFSISLILIISFSFLTNTLISSHEKSLSSQLKAESMLYVNSISNTLIDPILTEDYPLVESALTRLRNKFSKKIIQIQIIKNQRIIANAGNRKSHSNAKLHRIDSKIFAPDHLGNPKWTIGTISIWVSKELMINDIKKTKNNLVLKLSGIFIIIFLLIFLILQKFIISPISKLAEFTKSIGLGNLEDQINLKSNDEVGELGESFNSMIDSLQKSQEKLIQTEKQISLGLLGSGLSHELNNPLTCIIGYNRVLRRKLETHHPEAFKETKYYLDRMAKSTERISKIVHYSCQFSGILNYDTSRTCLKTCLENSFTLHETQLSKLGIVVNKRIDLQNSWIEGDPKQLELVFSNLINNATDSLSLRGLYSEKLLKVQTKLLDEHIEVSFTDNGVGIEKNNISRIFDPFYTTKDFGQGLGLGLSVSLGIISEHGGELSVTSKVGEETSFKITLPTLS